MGTFCLLPYLISSHIKRVFITSFMINKPRGKNWYRINENKNNVLIPFEKYKVIFDVFNMVQFCGNLSDPIYHPDFIKTLKYLKILLNYTNFLWNPLSALMIFH